MWDVQSMERRSPIARTSLPVKEPIYVVCFQKILGIL